MNGSESLARETRSSIELQRAKDSTYYWTLKAYYEEGQADEALATLRHVDEQLRATYLPGVEE